MATSSTNVVKGKEVNRKKLTKVLSTKVSTEDYDRFKKYAKYSYESGLIEEPKTSVYLRFIVTYPFNERGLH
jgi:hypothetical protein